MPPFCTTRCELLVSAKPAALSTVIIRPNGLSALLTLAFTGEVKRYFKSTVTRTYQALEPEFRLYLSFQVEGDLMDGWFTQS
jgi:hypothetical protein